MRDAPLLDLLDDICRNNHGGNLNSEVANMVTKKAHDQARIYDHVHGLGLDGATGAEVGDALGMLAQTVSARFSEMKRDGLLIETDRRRLTRVGGCPAVVCITKGVWQSLTEPS